MSDHFQPTPPPAPTPPPFLAPDPALPHWLARRLLRDGETIVYVRGPRFNPSWERYATHPALFLVALTIGAACVWIGRLTVPTWDDLPPWSIGAAVSIIIGSIFVLGLSAGYFTRLVVTTTRVVIIQGYETCRTWQIEEMPLSLRRRSAIRGTEENWTIDLDSLKTMIGGSSDQFVESKTIMAFAKKLDRMRARDDD